MATSKKITKVPNGPLIKKKGPFKGSSLKKGGVVKAQQGISRSKTVLRSPDNTYKTVIKSKTGPGMEKRSVKETRTIKGFIKGVPTIPKVMEKRRETAPLINQEPQEKKMIAKNGGKLKTKYKK